jgi:beta-lactamase class A
MIDEEWLQRRLCERITGESMRCSVYCRDLTTGQELVWNDGIMPSASLIKVPIMIEAFCQAQDGQFDFDGEFAIYDAVEGGSFYDLPTGTVVTGQALVQHMIVESDNTCANMLMDVLGMDRINEKIRQLGLEHTFLKRKMMDYDAVTRGFQNLTTAADMGKLFQLLYEGRCLDHRSDEAMLDILRWQEDNTIIPAQLPHPVRIDHKTGELEGINHDCGIVYAPNGPFILCLLAQGVSDEPQGLFDMSCLAKDIYDIMAVPR